MSERIIRISPASAAYDAVVGEGVLDSLGERLVALGRSNSVFIISDSNVAPLYLDRAAASLEQAGFSVSSGVFVAGEESKNLGTLGELLEGMATAGLTRTSTVIALGGGVAGDTAGLAAGLYMRGIAYVQVPTSLLAMVDSSVGGKCAVDLKAGKNLAGIFKQPLLVLADVSCLRTLPNEVFSDGCAEIIKHAVLTDPELFCDLHDNPLSKDDDAQRLIDIVSRNIDIKRSVVESDERESGPRKLLNLGHSIGHAVEAASNFELGHGHAVSVGLAAICRAGEARGWTETGVAQAVAETLERHGLPIGCTYSTAELSSFGHLDKKRTVQGIDLVIPERIGSCFLKQVDLAEFDAIIELGVAQR